MSNPNPSSSIPSDYEDMEFKVEEEDWNVYELEDGVTIKGRIFLSKIIRDPNDPTKLTFDMSAPKSAVYAPVHFRGKPSVELLKDLAKQKTADKYKVHVDKSHEPWNVYRILRTAQEVKIKLTIDEVLRFKDAYDLNGTPFYNVPNGIAVAVKGNQPHQGQ